MVEAPPDALEVADAVAVRVLERARIDLVDDAALPPGVLRHHAAPMLREAAAAGRPLANSKRTRWFGSPPRKPPGTGPGHAGCPVLRRGSVRLEKQRACTAGARRYPVGAELDGDVVS